MAIIRSSISPYKRVKRGKILWIARGTYPERQPDGTIRRQRYEEGITGKTGRARQEYCDALNSSYEQKALAVVRPRTFREAMKTYLGKRHQRPVWHDRLLAELGELLCHEIKDDRVTELTEKYAKGLSASYINRHYYTPIKAVLKLASEAGCCDVPNFRRPKGHKDVTPIEIPDGPSWYAKVGAHLSPDMQALLLGLTIHGRRLGELIGRASEDFDPDAGALTVGRTKTGEPLHISLHPAVVAAMNAMPGWRERRWLFGGHVRNRPSAAREAIQRACAKAGVPYYTPHELGRHAFATRLLLAGHSLEHVRLAGGWKTIEMVSRRYGHLAKSEITRVVHDEGEKFLLSMGTSGGHASPCLTNATVVAEYLRPEEDKSFKNIEHKTDEAGHDK
jgi:integrase